MSNRPSNVEQVFFGSNVNNDQTNTNDQSSDPDANRTRHLTNMQLAQQVNQLANTLVKFQNDQQAFQQQLLAEIGQNINAAVTAAMKEMKQDNNAATQSAARPDGQSAAQSPGVQVMNQMMKPPKPDKFDGEAEWEAILGHQRPRIQINAVHLFQASGMGQKTMETSAINEDQIRNDPDINLEQNCNEGVKEIENLSHEQLDEFERINNQNHVVNTALEQDSERNHKIIVEGTSLRCEMENSELIIHDLSINSGITQYDYDLNWSFTGLRDQSYINYMNGTNGTTTGKMHATHITVMKLLEFAQLDYEDWNWLNESMQMPQRNDLPFDPGPRQTTIFG